jgi:hypothetical protein
VVQKREIWNASHKRGVTFRSDGNCVFNGIWQSFWKRVTANRGEKIFAKKVKQITLKSVNGALAPP